MKHNQSQILLLLLIVALSIIMVACGGDSDDAAASDTAPSPPVEPRAYTDWTLTVVSSNVYTDMENAYWAAHPEHAPLDGEGGFSIESFALVSPNGDALVVMGRIEYHDGKDTDIVACRYELTNADIACSVVEDDARRIEPVPVRAAWSPDGTRVAMHEDRARDVLDSDIWVLDVATLALTNLTDDGYSGHWLRPDRGESVVQDHLPLWSLNGDLYFFRVVDDGEGFTNVLYRMVGGQGEPELVLEMPKYWNTFDMYTTAHAAMSPDGTRIALLPQQLESPSTRGVWMIDLQTQTVEEFVPADALQFAIPTWSDRPDEDDGLVLYPHQIVWDTNGSRLLVMTAEPKNALWDIVESVNVLAIDVASKDAVALIDYDAFENAQDARNHWDPLPGGRWMLSPDGGTLFFVSYKPDDDDLSIFAIPTTFDENAVVVGVLPEDLYSFMLFQSGPWTTGSLEHVSANGNVLMTSVLLNIN